jgi:hypothetical protein
MLDAKLRLLVSGWRARAEEILAQVEIMQDASAQQMVREITARYKRLAQRVEEEAREDNGVDADGRLIRSTQRQSRGGLRVAPAFVFTRPGLQGVAAPSSLYCCAGRML